MPLSTKCICRRRWRALGLMETPVAHCSYPLWRLYQSDRWIERDSIYFVNGTIQVAWELPFIWLQHQTDFWQPGDGLPRKQWGLFNWITATGTYNSTQPENMEYAINSWPAQHSRTERIIDRTAALWYSGEAVSFNVTAFLLVKQLHRYVICCNAC